MGIFRGFVHYLPASRRRRNEEGFSLVETLAAMVVFGIITLGLIPLLAGSIRGSDISRKATAGKQLATEAMERARGLPYYIDYNAQARRVDVLDLYFPGRTPAFSATNCTGYLATGTVTCAATGYVATGPAYITTCPNAANPACPLDMPNDYTLTYEMSFVGGSTTTPETYTKATPAATYTYNSSGNDLPTKLLSQLVVTARWTQTGRGVRTYVVRTLLSDRRFSGLKVLGEANVDYAAQFVIGYPERGATNESELSITAGVASSRIEARRVATAAASVSGGELTLIDLVLAEDAIENNEKLGGTPLYGVTSSQVAPPDATVNPAQVGRVAVSHPSGTYQEVGGIDISDGDSVTATTVGALPAAAADFDFSPSSSEDVWVTNRRADIRGDPLNLKNPHEWVARIITKSSTTLQGATSATTNALGTQPGVRTTATTSFKELQLFNNDDVSLMSSVFDGAAIAVSGPRDVSGNPSGVFTSSATCNADNDNTANLSPASVTYSGTLWYWRDPTEDDLRGGSYQWIDLATGNSSALGAGTSLSTTLEAIQSGAPVLISDESPDTRDVYLFESGTNWYLTDWAGSESATTSSINNGRVTNAKLDKVLSLETGAIEATGDLDSSLGISIGSVNCRAEDYR